MLSHKRGLRTELRMRRYEQKMGSSCRNSSRGSKGQRPWRGLEGQRPRKKITFQRHKSGKNQGRNQVQSIKTEKTRKAEKLTKPPERFGQSARAEFFPIRAETTREQSFQKLNIRSSGLQNRPSGFNKILGFARVRTGVVFRVLLSPYEPINSEKRSSPRVTLEYQFLCYNLLREEEKSCRRKMEGLLHQLSAVLATMLG